jgi:hypothetical protein
MTRSTAIYYEMLANSYLKHGFTVRLLPLLLLYPNPQSTEVSLVYCKVTVYVQFSSSGVNSTEKWWSAKIKMGWVLRQQRPRNYRSIRLARKNRPSSFLTIIGSRTFREVYSHSGAVAVAEYSCSSQKSYVSLKAIGG